MARKAWGETVSISCLYTSAKSYTCNAYMHLKNCGLAFEHLPTQTHFLKNLPHFFSHPEKSKQKKGLSWVRDSSYTDLWIPVLRKNVLKLLAESCYSSSGFLFPQQTISTVEIQTRISQRLTSLVLLGFRAYFSNFPILFGDQPQDIANDFSSSFDSSESIITTKKLKILILKKCVKNSDVTQVCENEFE